MSDVAAPGWKTLFARPNGVYLATFSLGSALYAFSAFLVAACMPSAVTVLGHLHLMSWAFTFYLIAAIVAGTLATPMKRRLGTATALQGAALFFLAGTLACGFAPDIWVLLAGRVLQGIGEGAISGLIYMLIPEIFPAVLIPAIFGIEAVIWASGSTIAPMLGGFLTQTISWRAAFLVEVPMVLVFMALVWANIPRRADSLPVHALPLTRLLGVGLAILLLSVAAIEPAIWMRGASIAAATALLVALVRRDARSANRLLPAGAFAWRSPLGLTFWIVLLMPAASTGPNTYAILTLERVWALDPLPASILGGLTYIAWSITGIAVSRMPPRLSATCLWLGPILLALGLFTGALGMLRISLAPLLTGLIFGGIGYGLSWGFLSQAIMTGAGPDDGDRASAMLPTVLSTGLAIGAALGGVAANTAGLGARVSPQMVARAELFCFLLASVLGAAICLVSLRMRAGRVVQERQPSASF